MEKKAITQMDVAELTKRLKPHNDAVGAAGAALAESRREYNQRDSTAQDIRNLERSILDTNSEIVDRLADGKKVDELKAQKVAQQERLATLRARLAVAGEVAERQAAYDATRTARGQAADALENDCRIYIGGVVSAALVSLVEAMKEYQAISGLLNAAGGRPPELSAIVGVDRYIYPDLEKFVKTVGSHFNARRGSDELDAGRQWMLEAKNAGVK